MKIIIGLGNPGEKYEKTRHNIGFDIVSLFADSKMPIFSEWKLNKKFNSEISEGKIGKTKIVLAKPQTFMNNSGEAVSCISRFYKVSSKDIIIIHDDIDLPFGKIRIKKTGSSGGHRGLESIIKFLGNENFVRLKVGVGPKKKINDDAAKLVLKKITKTEDKIISETKEKAVEAIVSILEDGLEAAMNYFN
jgi:PTH1 family peptidyl-tRNA hydrolase